MEDMRRMVVKEAGLDSTTKIDLQTVIQVHTRNNFLGVNVYLESVFVYIDSRFHPERRFN